MSTASLPRRFRLLASLVACLCVANTGVRAESLLDVYELAKEHDPQLKANNAALRGAFADARLLRAGILPHISARANYQRDRGRQSSVSPLSQIYGNEADAAVRFDTEARRESYSVSLSQTLFSLPAIYDARSATHIRKRATALLAEEQQQLILRVTEIYFGVLRQGENLHAARQTEKAISRQNQLVRNRFETGLASATDLLETRLSHDTSRANRIDQEARYYEELSKLGVLTGSDIQNLWGLGDDFPVVSPHPANVRSWTNIALGNNYRLRAAQLALSSAKNAWAARKSAHAPSLSASLTQRRSDVESTSYDTDSSDESNTRSLEVRLEVPIYSGGQLHAGRQRAYQEYLQARAQLTATRRDVLRQVRTLHNLITSHVARITALKNVTESAQRALLSIRSGYETGTREILDVLNAERELYQTQRDYNHARIDYLLDSLRIKAHTGALRETDLRIVNDRLKNEGSNRHPHVLPASNTTPT